MPWQHVYQLGLLCNHWHKHCLITKHWSNHFWVKFYNISMEDLIKESRKKEFVKPRQIAMYLIRKELDNSFPSIGDFFGGRDHTTVMHAVDKVEN